MVCRLFRNAIVVFLLAVLVPVSMAAAEADRTAISGADPTTQKVSSAAVLFPVRQNGKFGYIDATGKLAIGYRFESAEMFSDGLGMVRYGGKFGFVDADGKFVIAPQFVDARPFSEGRTVAVSGDEILLLDTEGKRVASLKHMIVGRFVEGRAPILKLGKLGFIDRDGHIVIEPRYDGSAGPYWQGIAPAGLKKGRKSPDWEHEWGYIDLEGKAVVPAQFRKAGAFSDGLAPVQVDLLWAYIDRSGQIVIQPQFYDAAPFSSGLARIAERDNTGHIHYGFIDSGGKIVIKPQFDMADHFSEDRAAVKVSGKWGYIDKLGKIVVKPQFYYAESYRHGLGHVMRKTSDGKLFDNYLNFSGQVSPITASP